MGFLDRKSRVVDVVLTAHGRRLFANGELDFAYYAFFDDGIDYDPYSTGSLTDTERDDLIHSSPMLEASVIPDRRSLLIPLEPVNQLFGEAPGVPTVARILLPLSGTQVDLRCDQVQSDGVYRRSATGVTQIDLELSGEAPPSEGFSIHVYSSGSDGLHELLPRRDSRGRRSLDPFVAVALDDEKVLGGPVPGRPETQRKGGQDLGPDVSRTAVKRRTK